MLAAIVQGMVVLVIAMFCFCLLMFCIDTVVDWRLKRSQRRRRRLKESQAHHPSQRPQTDLQRALEAYLKENA